MENLTKTNYTPNIVCPHCGYEDNDSWEYQADSSEIDCASCGEPFFYERHVEVIYSTWTLRKIPKSLLHRIDAINANLRASKMGVGIRTGHLITFGDDLEVTFHAKINGGIRISFKDYKEGRTKGATIVGDNIEREQKIMEMDFETLERCVDMIESCIVIPDALLERINAIGVKVRSMAGQIPTIQKQELADVMSYTHVDEKVELLITFSAQNTGDNRISVWNKTDKWFRCAIIEGNKIKPVNPAVNRLTDLTILERCVGLIESLF